MLNTITKATKNLGNRVKYFFLNRWNYRITLKRKRKQWGIGVFSQLYSNCFLFGLHIGRHQYAIGWATNKYKRRKAHRLMPAMIERLCERFTGKASYEILSWELYDIVVNGEAVSLHNKLKSSFPQPQSQYDTWLVRLLRTWSNAIQGWYVYDSRLKSFKFKTLKQMSKLSQEYAIAELKRKGNYADEKDFIS